MKRSSSRFKLNFFGSNCGDPPENRFKSKLLDHFKIRIRAKIFGLLVIYSGLNYCQDFCFEENNTFDIKLYGTPM